jgi:hypothetical protein
MRSRKLLFPFSLPRWLSGYLGMIWPGCSDDPIARELRRLKPYYRGTRLLASAAALLVMLAFLLPFSVVFVGMEGFYWLLAAYVVALVLASLLGMVLEVVLDAIFALMHETRASFSASLGTLLSFKGPRRSLLLEYMVLKLAIDMFLAAVIAAAFMPVLLGATALMLRVIDAVQAGVDARSEAYAGLAVIAALALLGLLVTFLVTMFASAFYGYYTEEALKLIRE